MALTQEMIDILERNAPGKCLNHTFIDCNEKCPHTDCFNHVIHKAKQTQEEA